MNNRITWVDIAKGYGIILVILGHLDIGPLKQWIYTFHLPLFFFLSGYVIKINFSFSDFIIKKLKTLFVPYFLLGLPMLCFHIFNSKLNDTQSLQLLVNFLLQKRFYTLWFIACLLCLNILFYLLVKKCKNLNQLSIISSALGIVGIIYYRLGFSALPWNMDVCLTALPFFCLGYIFKNNENISNFVLKSKYSLLLFFIFFIINLIGTYIYINFDYGLEMYLSKYGIELITYLSAISGIFCTIFISYKFNIKPIKYIGENSLLYFAWHQSIIIPILNKAIKYYGLFSYNIVLKNIVLLVLTLLILTILNIIIKSKFKFMLGK